jgi:SAM-dependent methyltransferase
VKITRIDPPRRFETGRSEKIEISDCARIELDANEQVTFVGGDGHEWDVARKKWGYYGTPSLNGRLVTHGLRAALARSDAGKYYLFLVERGHEPEVERYLAAEQNRIVRWLDNDDDLRASETTEVAASPSVTCICGGHRLTTVHMYWAPPEGEVRFPWKGDYRREIFRCDVCGHFLSMHRMETDGAFYEERYVASTYGDAAGMRRAFDRIVALDPDQSDNVGRVARIVRFAERHLPEERRSVLDVGSGLCVFLHRMKQHGWRCTALDPDARAVTHAREVAGVDAVQGDFATARDLGRYDLVTFNKVLEHVTDPIALLRRAAGVVADGGFVYIELPDGEAAAADAGFGREEFFVEHDHVFSFASLALLAARAGFRVLELERLREPSTKFTLRAFLQKGNP